MKLIRRPAFLIAVIFIVKLLTCLYFVGLARCKNPEQIQGIASMSGDAQSYIGPVDSLLEKNEYVWNGYRAARMPYVGASYYLGRVMSLDRDSALSLAVIIQVLVETIAIYFMALLCSKLLKREWALTLFVLLSLFSTYASIFNYYMLSESLAISLTCLFLYHYYCYMTEGRGRKRLLFAGIFLGLAVLFKPYLLALFLFIGIEYLIYLYRTRGMNVIRAVLIFTLIVSAPLIVLDLPWTIRNIVVLNKVVPFQEDEYGGTKPLPADMAVRSFIEATGESMVFWDTKSAGNYFINNNSQYQWPERVFSERLTPALIEDSRDSYAYYQFHMNDSTEHEVEQRFKELTEIYRNDHPIFYHFGAPLNITRLYLFHSGSYYLPIAKDNPCYSRYQMLIKLAQSGLYYLVLLGGFAGLILWSRKEIFARLLLSIPVFLVILFPIILRTAEARYFHLAYPVLLIGVCYLIVRTRDWYVKRR